MRTVGIIGLGLIGGSFAKALRKAGDFRIGGFDVDEHILSTAELEGAIDFRIDADSMGDCEMMIIALPPRAALAFLVENSVRMAKGTTVLDVCGVKREICPAAWRLAAEHGYVFVGGHPMAGREKSGFRRSTDTLFSGASMLLCFESVPDLAWLSGFKKFLMGLGFGKVILTTPEKHDRIIAYTSQLAHVLSSSYVKSPTAEEHHGYSAGSFRDMIRVASVDPELWADLFVENRDFLAGEVETLISNLSNYAAALRSGDRKKLVKLLAEGGDAKASIDSHRMGRQ